MARFSRARGTLQGPTADRNSASAMRYESRRNNFIALEIQMQELIECTAPIVCERFAIDKTMAAVEL